MLIAISLILLVFGFYHITKADTGNILYVGGVGSGNYTKIQYAIDNSSIGDKIYVYSGNYSENIVISHAIDLIGEDKNTTVIYAPNEIGNVISLSASHVNITGFKIMYGYDTNGLIIEGDNNNIFGNIFYDNFYGIKIQETAVNNLIYHNNFIMNIFSAIDYSNNKNQWDNGLEGNFWDDYNGTDANGDGIGDTSYKIDEVGNQDLHPLMYPWPSTEINISIDIIYCKNLGYLIDENSDGIYNLFYSNQTGIKTVTEKQQDGSYLINNDMDNDWEYTYNMQTGTLASYSSEEQKADNTIYYMLIRLIH